MQVLTRLAHDQGSAWYRLGGEYECPVERYVISTPETRAICNQPELLGVAYNQALEAGMRRALELAPFSDWIRNHPQHRTCVVHFLRGGLNFELRRALHSAYGFNLHSSAFLSSQRQRVEGRWVVQEDMYRKLDIPSDAILVMGDVVATGVTMENGLMVVGEHVQRIGSSLKGLVFFTIGCHKSEKILCRIHEEFQRRFPGYERTVLVYLEAKFRLVDSRTRLRIGIPGTDLIRQHALLSPEFEASQFEDPAFPLERCAIYDAGSRAFDIPNYVSDVLEYWEQMERFAHRGWTLSEALQERWPLPPYQDLASLIQQRQQIWEGVSTAVIERLHQQYQQWWAGQAGQDLRTAAALASVSRRRVATLKAIVHDAGNTPERQA